jgi:hypothetical protein
MKYRISAELNYLLLFMSEVRHFVPWSEVIEAPSYIELQNL